MKKYFFISLGICSVILGIIGLFLPVMPTVPFMILAAFFFSRSSKKMHEWVLNLPKVGPAVRDWEENGRISFKVKIISVLAILVFIGSSIYFVPILAVKYTLVMIGLALIGFIISRPD